MNAREIMSSPVVTIAAGTAVCDAARLLVERKISGVPVVAHGEVIGIVNEGDLLRRHEIGTADAAPRRSWWGRLVEREPMPADYVKSHARRVADVMSRDVVTVGEEATARHIASIFTARHIRRIPVLRDGALVGIVTRADLIRELSLTTQEVPLDEAALSDEAIRLRLLRELEQQRWWRPDWSAVHVRNAVVHYRGLIRSDEERRAARVAAENVPGVRGVEDGRIRGGSWLPMH